MRCSMPFLVRPQIGATVPTGLFRREGEGEGEGGSEEIDVGHLQLILEVGGFICSCSVLHDPFCAVIAAFFQFELSLSR